MKKIIFSVAAVCAFGFVRAQDTQTPVSSSKNVAFGTKLGLNISNIEGDENATAVPNFHGGFFVELRVNENLSIQPELLFSMQGAKDKSKITEDGIVYDVEEKLKLTYLNVPIMAKYYIDKKFSVLAGPQIGLLLSAKDEFTVSDGVNSGSDELDVKDDMKTLDLGFNAGLSYSFTDRISAEVRYNLGLSNIFDTDESDVEGFNRVFQISIAYKF